MAITISSSMPKVGDLILDFYKVETVKQGGMGVVYMCSVIQDENIIDLYKTLYEITGEISNPNQIRYAVKTLNEIYIDDNTLVSRFKWEAETWARIGHHENIVRAAHIFLKDRPYIVTEYVSGGDLYSYTLKIGSRNNGYYRLPIDNVISLSIQFCLGMEFADKAFRKFGIPFIHRDIKPENILITVDDVLKITDFGLVKAFEGSRNSEIKKSISTNYIIDKRLFSYNKGIRGTPPYMSPEQCRAIEKIDCRSDIYSFGCVMYQIITGKPPFSADSVEEYLFKHIECKPKEPKDHVGDVPNKLNDIVMKCLKKIPNERFANFIELRESIKSV